MYREKYIYFFDRQAIKDNNQISIVSSKGLLLDGLSHYAYFYYFVATVVC
jgi:hypothetical protein